jgi:hypothetical protein
VGNDIAPSTSVWTVSITRQTSARCAPRAFWISSWPPSTKQATRTQGIAASVAICGVPHRYCCNAFLEHIENIVGLLALPNAPMFFTFPDDADGMPSGRLSNSALKSANTAASCGYPGACSSACCRRHPPPNAALKHTICSGHALRKPPSGSCGGVS